VVVVSEETATISVVLGGEMIRGLDAPRLRVVLREILAGERRRLPTSAEAAELARPELGGGGEVDEVAERREPADRARSAG
jgi:hypothetical protein